MNRRGEAGTMRASFFDQGVFVSPTRRISFAFGVLFLITFATSIPALYLFQPVLDDPVGYVANGGSDNRIFFGRSSS